MNKQKSWLGGVAIPLKPRGVKLTLSPGAKNEGGTGFTQSPQFGFISVFSLAPRSRCRDFRIRIDANFVSMRVKALDL